MGFKGLANLALLTVVILPSLSVEAESTKKIKCMAQGNSATGS